MNKYLAADVETGGLTSDTSLLTVYLGVLDENFTLKKELYINCRPTDGPIIANAAALKVNGINIEEHEKIAVPYVIAAESVRNFLNSTETESWLIPVGHNVRFDLGRIADNLLGDTLWEKVSYQTLDTATVAGFLKDIDLLNCKASLSALATYYGLVQPTPHNARSDALLSVEIYKMMRQNVLRHLTQGVI